MAARTKRSAAGQAALSTGRRRFSAAFNEPVQLSTGVWVLIKPVSPSLIADAQANIEDPDVPTFFNEEKNRIEENPNDPKYSRALEKVGLERAQAGLDALILFGTELVDGPEGNPVDPPSDGKWVKKLKYFLEKIARVDASMYDFDDSLTVEYLYKRYMAVGPADIAVIAGASGISQEDIAAAEKSFRGDEERGSDIGTQSD